MIHTHTVMEVDSHSSFSPSIVRTGPGGFASLRHKAMNPSKRARSPEPIEGQVDRPTKRAFRHLRTGYSSGSSSRQTSEDWVQQTGGLSIDSPIFPTSEGVNQFTGVNPGEGIGVAGPASGDLDEDVDMAVGDSLPLSAMDASQERPHLAPLETPFQVQNPMHPFQPQQHPHPQDLSSSSMTPQRHSYETRHSARTQNFGPVPPMINVVPATPVGPGQQQPQNAIMVPSIGDADPFVSNAQPSRTATPPLSSPSPMPISPPGSFTMASPDTPGASKKRVVTFGPRANCEKCRHGERHFIHYDYE